MPRIFKKLKISKVGHLIEHTGWKRLTLRKRKIVKKSQKLSVLLNAKNKSLYIDFKGTFKKKLKSNKIRLVNTRSKHKISIVTKKIKLVKKKFKRYLNKQLKLIGRFEGLVPCTKKELIIVLKNLKRGLIFDSKWKKWEKNLIKTYRQYVKLKSIQNKLIFKKKKN